MRQNGRCHASWSTDIQAGIFTKKLVASGKHICKTCAADILVGGGMQNRVEMYTREEAIKNKLIQFRSKTIGPDLGNSFARPCGYGAWPCIGTDIYSRFPIRAFSHTAADPCLRLHFGLPTLTRVMETPARKTVCSVFHAFSRLKQDTVLIMALIC